MSRTTKRPYRKSRVFDKTCRNNGSCAYCSKNRQYKNNRRLLKNFTDLDYITKDNIRDE